MKIIRRYFLKEFFHNFFFSLLAISFFFLIGNLIQISDLIIRKGVEASSALKIFLFLAPYLLKFILPLSVLLSTLLTMGRISSDNEILALRSSGFFLGHILAMFIILGTIVSLFLVIVNDKIVPQAHFQSRVILKQIGKKNPLSFIEPGVFIDGFKDFILFVQDVDVNRLKKVFIYQVGKDNQNSLIFAEHGEFVVDGNIMHVKLSDGFMEGPQMKYRINFRTHFIHMPLGEQKQNVSRKPVDMSLKDLQEEIVRFEERNLDPLPLRVEFHQKISFSFSALIFALLGFGVGGNIKHREKSVNFGISFFTALFYYLFYMLAEALALKGLFPVGLCMWLPNFLFAVMGSYFSIRFCRS